MNRDKPIPAADIEKAANISLAEPALLEKIDKLFELNIGEDVALPQLLVVGDQSSGKSSVLEGLTNLPFPRGSGLCTRFATQIIFQRAQHQKIKVSIIPSANCSTDQADRLREWNKDGLQSLEGEVFFGILKEVHAVMELDSSDPASKTFSDDILNIEICGPDQEHLSVIDVPGIFKKTTEGLTTKSDIGMVRNMVFSYMNNPRAVILAVIPANVDIATQEILEMAAECDTEGERTLGVLTKPDLVDEGAEQHVLDLVEGKSHKLKLGWCIIRNRGQKELLESTDRHEVERNFFMSHNPWAKVEKDRVGVEALRRRLIEILAAIVRRQFGKVKDDINKKLRSCRQQLEALGPSRETKEQQQKFIFELATRFQMITSLAIGANYGGDKIFEGLDDLRLATRIIRRNELFATDLSRWGHTINFDEFRESSSSAYVLEATRESPVSPRVDNSKFKKIFRPPHSAVEEWMSDPDPEVASASVSPTVDDSKTKHFLSPRRFTDEDCIAELLPASIKLKEPSDEAILPWIKDIYNNSRGFELGTFNVTLLTLLWKKQSVKWDHLALGYISDVIIIVNKYTFALLRGICGDERVLNGLTSVLAEDLETRYRKAIDQVKFILCVERDCTPLTANHYFAETLEHSRQERKLSQAGNKQAYPHSMAPSAVEFKDSSRLNAANLSNAEHTVQDLHDILKAYYKVARKRFVDIVCMQGAVYHLISGPDASVRFFSPAFVTELKADALEMIAGESVSMRTKRRELIRKIGNLESGRKILM